MSLAQVEAHDFNAWRSVAERAAQHLETRLFINGDYVDAAGGGRFETINPASGEVIAAMSAGSAEGCPVRPFLLSLLM
jgi:gamma-glutamyl-gamma-aminobutyraldehyde dehydrogenase